MDKIRILDDLLARARAGKRPMGLVCAIDSADTVELAAAFGFDWLIIDTEHTSISTPAQVLELIRAAELHQVPTLVKLATWDPVRASDALDAGAFGIQVPFVHNLDMLNEVIRGCRFRPVGTRGFCPVARAAGYAVRPVEYERFLEFQSKHALIIPMIESEEAVENLDAMLANSPDCPVFGIGPEDLRLALDVPADKEGRAYMNKLLLALTRKIHAAGKLNSLPFLGPARENPPDVLAEDFEMYNNDLPYSADTSCLAYGFQELLRTRDTAAARSAKKT